MATRKKKPATKKVTKTKQPYKTMDVVMNIPDMGLSKPQVNKLKKKFESDVVDSLGGADAMKKIRIRVRVRVVLVIVNE